MKDSLHSWDLLDQAKLMSHSTESFAARHLRLGITVVVNLAISELHQLSFKRMDIVMACFLEEAGLLPGVHMQERAEERERASARC